MKGVSVDPELCIGSSECMRLVPAAFHLDRARGVSVPTEVAPSVDPALLARVVRSCPMQAISISEDTV